MKRMLIRLIAAVTAVFLALGSVAYAVVTPWITFEGDMKKGHFSFGPGSIYSSTDMFTNMKNMMPGDVREQPIILENRADVSCVLSLYVRSEWNSVSVKDLEDQFRITYSVDGANSGFKAGARLPSYLDDSHLIGVLNTTKKEKYDISDGWEHLGLLYTGGTVNLRAIAEMDINAGNQYQNAVGKVDFLIFAYCLKDGFDPLPLPFPIPLPFPLPWPWPGGSGSDGSGSESDGSGSESDSSGSEADGAGSESGSASGSDFWSGSASASASTSADPRDPHKPVKTGDDTNLLLPILVFVMSALAVAKLFVLLFRRKEADSDEEKDP